mgnify:CR=1 FL=1
MDNIIIYNTDDGAAKVSLYSNDGTVWITQAQMVELFHSSKSNISEHISHIFTEGELHEDSVVRNFRTTAADGKSYNTTFYSLDVILSVGFRVRSPRGTEFRRWANTTLREYLQKGFLIDDERLKNPDGRPDYFDELLARIVIFAQVKNDSIKSCATCSRSLWTMTRQRRKHSSFSPIFRTNLSLL